MHRHDPRCDKLRTLLVVLLLGSPVAAQLADWASLPVSPTAAPGLEQSYATVQDGTTVAGFSCLTRTWESITTFPGAVVSRSNEHFIVRDGQLFYGYSPRTGSFAAQLALSPSAALMAPGSPQTWHSVVVDGADVHMFFALSGQWTTFVFASPPTVQIGRFCVLINDGTTVYAVSSFYGTPVPLLVAGAVPAGAFGMNGMATSPGFVHGFSANRNTWATLSVAGTPTISNGNSQPAFVAINDGAAISFFSGQTGAFTTLPAAPAAATSLQRTVAIVVDGMTVYGYSSLLGTTAVTTFGAPPIVTMQQFYALVDDGASLTAFSPVTGTFAAPLAGPFAGLMQGAQVAAATLTGASYPSAVYSALLNSWVATPALSAATAYINAAAVVLVEPTGGLHGFSVQGSGWIFELSGVIDSVHVGSSAPALAMTLVARSGTTLYAFNPRMEAWRSTTTAAIPTTVQGNNAAIIARDGINAYGFGNWNDRWSSVPLAGPAVSSAAQVQSGYVFDGASVHGYSALGQLTTTGDFPDYFRVASQGSRVRFDLVGEPGSPSLIVLSAGPASIPSPYGTILIDLSTAFILTQPVIPAGGAFPLTLQIPIASGLSGTEVHFQAAIFGPLGLYLTNNIVMTVY